MVSPRKWMNLRGSSHPVMSSTEDDFIPKVNLLSLGTQRMEQQIPSVNIHVRTLRTCKTGSCGILEQTKPIIRSGC